MDPLDSIRQTFYPSPTPWSVATLYACFRLCGVDPDLGLTGFGIGVFLTVGWFLVFLVGVWFRQEWVFSILCIYLVAVFSAQALGAGFRPGVRPTVSTVLTKGWTGWRFFAALSSQMYAIVRAYYFGLRP